MTLRRIVLLFVALLLSAPAVAHAQGGGGVVVRRVLETLAKDGDVAGQMCRVGRLSEIGKLNQTLTMAQLTALKQVEGPITSAQLSELGLEGLMTEIEAEAASAALKDVVGPETGILRITPEEAVKLAKQGYVPRGELFTPEFADAFANEIDRLIDAGLLKPAADRVLNGQPTEWIVNLGIVWGNGPGSRIMQESPLLKSMFEELQEFGRSYNAVREQMIASGLVKAADAPPIAVEGAEMNVNLVIGGPGHQWTGLHMHRDMVRFNDSLIALDKEGVRHAAITARAFTFSGYARPLGEDGGRMNDAGGALPFFLRDATHNPGDKKIFDVVPAHHNTGAFFFPHTTHGVGRMPEVNTYGVPSMRYSFQVFFPEETTWNTLIKPRIESGELARELEQAAKTTGQTGWR